MNILAIDFGSKRLGFAIGNSSLKSAIPLSQVPRKSREHDLHYIRQLIAEYDIEKIVIGYPLLLDGSRSDTTSAVEQFHNWLKREIGLPIGLIDETLTSFEAEEMLKSIHPDFKKRKKMLDSVSALIILRNYLETI